MQWLVFKDMLSEWTGLSEDALHIYAAILLQLGSAAVLRSSVARALPWLCVLVALAANEAFDIYLPGHPIETWQIEGGIRDLWNTMLLPTVLLLLARFMPSLFDKPEALRRPALSAVADPVAAPDPQRPGEQRV